MSFAVHDPGNTYPSNPNFSEANTLPNFDRTMRAAIEVFYPQLADEQGFLGLAPFKADDRSPDERYHMQIFYDSGLARARGISLRRSAIEAQRFFQEQYGSRCNFGLVDINLGRVTESTFRLRDWARVAVLFEPVVGEAEVIDGYRQAWIKLVNGYKAPQRAQVTEKIITHLALREPLAVRAERREFWHTRVTHLFSSERTDN